jgi:hypothetical protein
LTFLLAPRNRISVVLQSRLMGHCIVRIAACLAIGGTCATPAYAGVGPLGIESMTGQYQCVTRYVKGPVFRFSTHNAPFGAWLRLDSTFAAQNGAAAFHAVTFLGIDPASKHWTIISVNPKSYYTRSSASAQLDGSQWKDLYPADGGLAELHVFDRTHYRFDLTTPPGGPADQSHTDCSASSGAG